MTKAALKALLGKQFGIIIMDPDIKTKTILLLLLHVPSVS